MRHQKNWSLRLLLLVLELDSCRDDILRTELAAPTISAARGRHDLHGI